MDSHLARKTCIIVNSEPVKIQSYHQLKQFMRKQKYPDKIIDDAIKKCKKADKKIYLTSLNRPKPNP